MCAYSAISDYYTKQWPDRFPNNPQPFIGDLVAQQLIREVLERLEKIDKRLNDIECNDDAKEEFKRQVGL